MATVATTTKTVEIQTNIEQCKCTSLMTTLPKYWQVPVQHEIWHKNH